MEPDSQDLTIGQLLRRVYQGHANGWLEGSASQPASLLWEMVATDFLYQYLERSKEQGDAAD